MLPKKETLTIEFNSDANGFSDSDLIEAIVSMANSEGGVIYLGVEDDGRVNGVNKNHMDLDGLRALVANKTVPSIFVSPSLLMEGNIPVLAIEIPLSEHIIARLKRRFR